MNKPSINAERLLGRIRALGDIGRDEAGRLTRLAGTDADKLGRDTLVGWAQDAGLDIRIDAIGNIFAIWPERDGRVEAPVMMGSHIDTVIDAGKLDGCYGVLAGLEVIQTLREVGHVPARPLVVAAFTNEEGVRFSPDMMGSAVFAGCLPGDSALDAVDREGATLGAELARIGYAGDEPAGFIKPLAYIELHIEQGPVLEREGFDIGAVDSLQGISWQRITIKGEANHAGTTPMSMRSDAGHAAAQIICFLHQIASGEGDRLVATVGTVGFSPNAINVVPGKAVLTVDMRSPDPQLLSDAEVRLAAFLANIREGSELSVDAETLARTEPVEFDHRIIHLIETAAQERQLRSRRITSGAGHDAQMLASITPTAMIFVPSERGISHNSLENTADQQLLLGANVLLDAVTLLCDASL